MQLMGVYNQNSGGPAPPYSGPWTQIGTGFTETYQEIQMVTYDNMNAYMGESLPNRFVFLQYTAAFTNALRIMRWDGSSTWTSVFNGSFSGVYQHTLGIAALEGTNIDIARWISQGAVSTPGLWKQRYTTGAITELSGTGGVLGGPTSAPIDNPVVAVSPTRILTTGVAVGFIRADAPDDGTSPWVETSMTTTPTSSYYFQRIAKFSATSFATLKDYSTYYELIMWSYDGNNTFTQVGNALSITKAVAGFVKPGFCKIQPTVNMVALARPDDNTLRSYWFDGTDWSEVGTSVAVNLSSAAVNSMTYVGDGQVALLNTGDASLQLKTYQIA